MLLEGKDKLLEEVSIKGILFNPQYFCLFKPRVYREQPRLVKLLRLQQSIDPVLLPLVHEFDLVLCLHQLSLVF